MRSLIVTENESGQRLDKLLAKYLNLAGKGFLYKMMRKKNITLNGKKCDGSEKLVTGDEVRLFFSDETIGKFSVHTLQEVKKVNLQIIYEDDHILLVNKPSGMLSQKAKDSDESLVEYIIDYLVSSGQLSTEQLKSFRPRSATAWTGTPAGSSSPASRCRGFRSCRRCLRTEACTSTTGVW